jgi:N6-adenosine-specific RNA methylase IME4
MSLPCGHFGALLIDAPFAFATRSEKGKGKSPERHYRCLSLAEIAALPVSDLAAPDAALFMWIPGPHICATERLVQGWGFRFSGFAWTWLKYNPATGRFAFGCGYGTRKNTEPCMLGLRGNPRRKSRSERDFILAPRRAHSRKPDEQYGKIERLYNGPYFELFARQTWPAWTSWGDQIHMFDLKPGARP